MSAKHFRSRSGLEATRRYQRAFVRGMSASRAMARPGLLAALLLVLAPVCVMLFKPALHATDNTIIVNTLDDPGTPSECSLRGAIENANSESTNSDNNCAAGTGNDTINFSVSGTITLGSLLPAIVNTLTIDGTGQSITVDGATSYQIFYVSSDATLSLANLTVSNGTSTYGGGVYNLGTLSVTNSTFSGNSAPSGAGGVFNDGTLTVTNSTFSGDSAEYGGGGILNDATLTVTNSTFSSNSAADGGGVYNLGTLTVTNSTFSGNSAEDGGGIFNAGGTLTVTNSTLSGNSAAYFGGGIANYVFAGPTGDNSGGTGSTAASTISGNVEPGGVNIAGRFLISIVAIQGSGASSAFTCPPTAPAPWIPIGDWSCNGGGGNEIHVAAGYRITDSNDAPGTAFSWTFSSTACDSPTPANFLASVTNTEYVGVNTTSPIDVVGFPTCNVGSAGASVIASAITTTQSNDLVVALFDAAGANQSLALPGTGSDLGPVVNESNSSQGPANFSAFANTLDIGTFNTGQFGDPGVYGPFSATQSQAGESLGVTLSLVAVNVFNARLSSSILSNNAGNAGGNCSGPVSNGGYNISDDDTCRFGTSSGANRKTIGDNVDPLLDPNGLQNNAGPTETIALQSGSPAIDAIPIADCPAIDQRGAPRPDPKDSATHPACDIGAFESGNLVWLQPSALDFGTVIAGQSSAPSDVTLTNGTGKTIKIRGTAIGRDFAIVSTTCPWPTGVLNAGQSCDYFISFQPRRAGTKKEAFKVSYTGGSQKVKLHGVATRR